MRRIEKNAFKIGIVRQDLEDAVPHALLRPAPEAGVDGEPVAKLLWQIAPGRTAPRDPQDRLDKQPIVPRRGAGIANFARQFWRNPVPLFLAQDRANQGWPPFSSLESELHRVGNRARHDECKQALVSDSEVPIQFERGRRGCGGRSARWSPGYRRLTWSSGAALGSRCVD